MTFDELMKRVFVKISAIVYKVFFFNDHRDDGAAALSSLAVSSDGEEKGILGRSRFFIPDTCESNLPTRNYMRLYALAPNIHGSFRASSCIAVVGITECRN